MLKKTALAAALLLAAAAAWAQKGPSSAQDYVERGNTYLEQGMYDKAIADYNAAIKLAPNDAWAYNGRGLAYYHKEMYDKAIADYNAALKIDPGYADAYNNRGLAYYNKEMYDETIADFNAALKIEPNDAWAYNSRGMAYANKGMYDEAIADYTAAIKLDPSDAWAYNNRGAAYADKGMYDQAIADYNAALKIDPENTYAGNNLKNAQQAQSEKDFQVKEENGGLTIVKYTGWDTELVIPAAIGGKPVLAIGDSAFSKAKLTALTLPAGLVRIGRDAFRGNPFKDADLIIPEGVRTIEAGAFSGGAFKSLTLPQSIESFKEMFGSQYEILSRPLSALPAVTLPGGIPYDFSDTLSAPVYYNYLANGAQAGTYTASTIAAEQREGDFSYYKTQYGAVITGYNGNESRLRIPETLGGLQVTAIAGAFNTKSLDNILLPAGLISIGQNAFRQNWGLMTLTIPASVRFIGRSAFYDCGLTSLTLSAGLLSIGNSAFRNNKLTSLTLPAGLTSIGGEAFRGNNITSLTLSAGLLSIGYEAFYGNKIASLTLPKGLLSIGDSAFYGNKISAVTIPATVTYIGKSAFDNIIIIIGANVWVEYNRDGWLEFGKFYNENGKKAGRYTYKHRSEHDPSEGWTYSAK
jgi:Flp pilus assembly protein TadD